MSVFERRHDFLVCVDLEGCVMDTLSCAHFHCFGPCLIRQWKLEQWRVPILERWNQVNLFQMTRGINRFEGLALVLSEVDRSYSPIAGIDALCRYVENVEVPSESNLTDAIDKATDGEGRGCLEKALSWSRAVDISIGQLPDELKLPFAGAKEGLGKAYDFADVAVLSDQTVMAEEYTGILLKQGKAEEIAQLLRFGYAPDHVLMVGDAPEDLDAAEKNGIWFYPILAGAEIESWQELQDAALYKFRSLDYADYQPEKIRQFLTNLDGREEM